MTSDLVVPESAVREAAGQRDLPSLGIIEQIWETDPLTGTALEQRARAAVGELDLSDVPDGGEVALAVGSRGIGDIVPITAAVIDELRDRGYEPFVFPAMGSHGGATADGQVEQLAAVGVTEAAIDCEIRSTMSVVEVGRTEDRDVPAVADEHAASADAVVPINRIKPHTDFDGAVESGLSKMLVIGMGKQRGAKIAHEWAVDWSLRNMIPAITEILLAELPVVGGVAILEDQRDQTASIEGIPPAGFLDRERELLERAYAEMPTLPFEELDVLVLDQQGKEISGQGMDTNVIGRRPFAINEPEPESPDIKRIYLRSLTEATHGNAMGMGSADFVHADVAAAVDATPTLINAITASTVRGVRLPPVLETDRAALIAALATVGVVEPDTLRLIRATDTMHLQRLYASPTLVAEAREREDLRVLREPEPIAFEDGNFVAPPPTE